MNDRKKLKSASPCGTCPWREENHGRENPEGFDPEALAEEHPDQNFYDWYTEENLLRLWGGNGKPGISDGEAMSCHATDGQACYVGKKSKGNPQPCFGSLALVMQHIRLYEAIIRLNQDLDADEIYAIYRKHAGDRPMTFEGIASWVSRITFDFSGTFPESVQPATATPPWEEPATPEEYVQAQEAEKAEDNDE